MPLAQQAGYYCNVCDCILRDSQSYLDHINGGRGPPCRPAGSRGQPWGASPDRLVGTDVAAESGSLSQWRETRAVDANPHSIVHPLTALPSGHLPNPLQASGTTVRWA